MIVNYKLDKSFGPIASITGVILFASGLILIWFSGVAIITILLGALIGFTYSGTEIDFDARKIRHSDVLFGVIKTGKWVKIKPEMKIGIVKSRKTWRTYSGGNRELETPVEDEQLVLFSGAGKKRIPLKKVISREEAQKEQDEFCRRLNIQKL